MIFPNLTSAVTRTARITLQKVGVHLPEILTGLGVACSIGAVGTAIYASVSEKTANELQPAIEELNDIHEAKETTPDDEYREMVSKSWWKVLKKLFKVYGLTMFLEVLGCAMMIAGHCVMASRLSSALAASALTEKLYAEAKTEPSVGIKRDDENKIVEVADLGRIHFVSASDTNDPRGRWYDEDEYPGCGTTFFMVGEMESVSSKCHFMKDQIERDDTDNNWLLKLRGWLSVLEAIRNDGGEEPPADQIHWLATHGWIYDKNNEHQIKSLPALRQLTGDDWDDRMRFEKGLEPRVYRWYNCSNESLFDEHGYLKKSLKAIEYAD